MMEVMQRSKGGAGLAWIPMSISYFLSKEHGFSVIDSQKAEKQCISEISMMSDIKLFDSILSKGFDILMRYPSYIDRVRVEDMLENSYRSAITFRNSRGLAGRNKPNSKSPEEIENTIQSYLAGSPVTPALANDIVSYAKYRHCEFEKTFLFADSNGNEHKFAVVLFTYVLPERRPVDLWKYHKGSISISSNGRYGKYQTCRWTFP
jgi:hypothetical protein